MHVKPKDVVVIGGGIAGATITRALSNAGVNVTLLEKAGQLCSGATWHAAGLVTRFGGSPKLKKVHVRSLALLCELEEKFGIGLHTPGSIRIIEKGNHNRYLEAKQNVAMAALYDDPAYPTSLISREEVAALHPLLDIDNVECGVYTPHDGDVDPTSLTNCVAKMAKENGASIRFNAEVERIEGVGSGDDLTYRVHVKGQDEPLVCDTIVNAAGLWSRGVSDMAPFPELIDHPAFVIEHQYAITDTIPQVKELASQGHNGGRLPVLRDLRGSSYIRQEGNGFLIGPYEGECIVRRDMPRGPPSSFIMELFPDELERIEGNLMQGMELVPCLGEVGFKTIVNGPTIWTGDSLARVGRTKIPGWYDFNSLTYGIAQSLALSEYLAHIMLEGEQPASFDASDYFDPLRYGKWANDSYTESKIKETYTHNNSISYGSYENRSGGLEHVPVQYPLHGVLKEQGAVFGAIAGSGVEAPLCYPSTLQNEAVHDSKRYHDFPWTGVAEEEAKHALEHVGLSYSSFSKLRVTGADSKEFMQAVTTGALPVSKDSDLPCKLTYCATPKGRVQTEFTICRKNKAGDDWYLVGSRDHAQQDIAWLKQCIPQGKQVSIENVTDDRCVLHLCGPKSGDLLGSIESGISGLGFMRARPFDKFGGLDGIDPVEVFRVSFSGELGFELHFSSKDGPKLHQLIVEHPRSQELGLRHIGSAAINSMRIEQGFKFRADLDFAHYKEAGIGPFVAKKRSFIGRDDAYQPERQSAMFRIETDPTWEWSIVGDTPIRRKSDDKVVGFTTTSCRGASTSATIALGYVNGAYDESDPNDLYIDTFGFNWPVQVLEEPIKQVNRAVWEAQPSSEPEMVAQG
uniref:Dimethylglycine dehydrogenase n=1 Tax=Mucochytrium quahogii TaxID=96639 RepID=A0A7S2WIX2_9STRA|mmetsp:Transcript_28116/g.45107  ORF Transcript_28116/g.45107 Transcript_28116/m.45107 type:complete len:855 (+) Transcript_28116:286-2850(+)